MKISVVLSAPHHAAALTSIAAFLSPHIASAQVESIDADAFARCIDPSAKVEKLAGDMKFTEGPVWVGGKEGKLIFSDIPANELKAWTPDGGLTVFRADSRNANGNTTDLNELLLTAEHSGRRLSRTAADGTITTVTDQHDGKKFNSPNDVVVKSDGTIWFTDPPYGLPAGAAKEQEGHFVFRFDPQTKKTQIVSREHDMPNGLAFSPDETKLYVADSGKPRAIRVYDVKADGSLSEGREFCTIDKGGPDGIRVDHEGRVWSSAGDGVQVFAPDGTRIGRVLTPEGAANLAFGGPDGKTLYITARTSLYAVPVKVKDGAKR